MDNYLTNILIGYAKAGIIAWILWFVYAMIYIMWNFKLDLSLYRDAKSKGKVRKFYSALIFILWPWGLFQSTNNIVKYVNNRLRRKEKN